MAFVDVVERLVKQIGYSICHQIPERSLFIAGRQLPVCARDTGIFVGFGLAVLFAFAFLRQESFRSTKSRILLSMLVMPALFDAATSYLGLRDTNNGVRLVTGFLAGIGIASLILSCRKDLFDSKEYPLFSKTAQRLAKMLFTLYVAVILSAFLLRNFPDVSYLLASLALVSAIIITLMFLNSALVILLGGKRFGNKSFFDHKTVMLTSLLISVGELAVSNRLHHLAERLLA